MRRGRLSELGEGRGEGEDPQKGELGAAWRECQTGWGAKPIYSAREDPGKILGVSTVGLGQQPLWV